jgi:hypothetical protein
MQIHDSCPAPIGVDDLASSEHRCALRASFRLARVSGADVDFRSGTRWGAGDTGAAARTSGFEAGGFGVTLCWGRAGGRTLSANFLGQRAIDGEQYGRVL